MFDEASRGRGRDLGFRVDGGPWPLPRRASGSPRGSRPAVAAPVKATAAVGLGRAQARGTSPSCRATTCVLEIESGEFQVGPFAANPDESSDDRPGRIRLRVERKLLRGPAIGPMDASKIGIDVRPNQPADAPTARRRTRIAAEAVPDHGTAG